VHGRVVESRLESRVLRGNRLGDPHVRDLLVYLPPGYDPAGPRLPSVLVLPGFAANHRSIVGFDPWKPNTVEAFDAQIVAGESPPALLVLPDCVTRWGGSQFLDSAATGAYQTYLADEVIPHVDRTFRTIPAREGRAVVGKSSGGFGALRLGMDRPELVSAIGSHAGDAAFEITMRPLLTTAAIAMAKAGGLGAFAERVVQGGPRGAMEFDAVFVLAASAAYAPEPSNDPPFCALPVDLATGELVPEVWARWLAHDPLRLVDARADALRSMRAVYLDAGDVDEHGLCFAARALEASLAKHGAPVVRHEFEGGHRGTSGRYAVSLPFLIEALEGADEA
jgi:enterochelin esterase family protein